MTPTTEAIRQCGLNIIDICTMAQDGATREQAESLVRELEELVLTARQDSGMEWVVLCVGVAIGVIAQPLLARLWAGLCKGFTDANE